MLFETIPLRLAAFLPHSHLSADKVREEDSYTDQNRSLFFGVLRMDRHLAMKLRYISLFAPQTIARHPLLPVP
ncbi:hypothetical protein D3C73_928380 [compost metagenome]